MNRFFCLTSILASCLFEMPGIALGDRLLIDDFSLDQVGITTDQFAAYDTIDFVSPIGDYRELWGGGASVDGNCEITEMSVFVGDGAMGVTNGPDCYGGGCVRWGGSETVDISKYTSIGINVADIVGSIRIRISLAKDLLAIRQLDATLDRTGEHVFDFEDFNKGFGTVDLSELRTLNICMAVEQGEYVALDSVSLIVPEPRLVVVAVSMLVALFGLRNCRSRLLSTARLLAN